MISSGELYDLRGELEEEKELSFDNCSRLIDECHRLKHLIEEIIDFRQTKQHDEMMKKLNIILEKSK